jgi:hypothetical protein
VGETAIVSVRCAQSFAKCIKWSMVADIIT